MLASLFALVLAIVPALAQFDAGHNTTSIVGTWSSGTQNVVTGSGFANPAQESFTFPPTAGVGYAFSDDGWYEIARLRYVGNSSDPSCIVSTLVWAHGAYELLLNGSIVLTPAGDGYQQVQSSCGKSSSFVQNYNVTELYQSWRIFTDVTFGPKLHLFQFDGTPVAPLFRLSPTPNMLPKRKLRNNHVSYVTTTKQGLTTVETVISKREHSSSNGRRWWPW